MSSIVPGRHRKAPGFVPTQPNAPSGVTLLGTSTPGIIVSWTDNSDDETGFLVQRSSDGISGWVTVHTTPPNWTSYEDTPGPGTYYYRVIANALLPSVPSEVAGPEFI